MDKKEALNKYRSNPKVKKVLELIIEEENWIYDLYDLVQKRINYFFKLNYYNNDKLKNDLSVLIFGNVLLSIVESDTKKFLTHIYPVRVKYRTKKEIRNGKGVISGRIPLTKYDSRRLIKSTVNTLINRYLNISTVFVRFLKHEESIVRTEYLSLFKEKENLEKDLKAVYSTINETTQNSIRKSKFTVGSNPLFGTRQEFINALDGIPKESTKSLRKIGEYLNISANTAKKYIEEFSIDNSILPMLKCVQK